MSKPIYLKLDTYKGIVTIPFNGLEEVDYFTVMYDNMGMLVTSLIKLLKLPLDLYDVNEVYLSYDKYNRGYDNKSLPIKYSVNNFNFESLKEAFVNYLKNDPKRIFDTDMRYMNIDIVLRYFDTGILDSYALEEAVRRFFADGNGYKRRRDVYFLILDTINSDKKDDENKDKNINIVIDTVKFKSSLQIDRGNLSVHGTGEDDDLNNLVELSRRYPELHDKVMDEIGQTDIEDIKRHLNNDDYGIVDGAIRVTSSMKMERAVLEETTGLSIENLRTNHVSFGRKRRPR